MLRENRLPLYGRAIKSRIVCLSKQQEREELWGDWWQTGDVTVRQEEKSVPAGCKTITHTTKIISGEFEGNLIHVERGINIKQMLPLVCRLLATQEAARLEQSLRLWSKDMISCSGSFCPDLISEHLQFKQELYIHYIKRHITFFSSVSQIKSN